MTQTSESNTGDETHTQMRSIIAASILTVLAFIPFVPAVDVMAGGGTTLNGAIELILIGSGIGLMILSNSPIKTNEVYLTPAVTLSGEFTVWAMLTAIWSYNPILTAAKSLELGLIIVAAVLLVRLARNVPRGSYNISNYLVVAFGLAILCLIIANILIWRTPIPFRTDGNVAVAEDESNLLRPRAVCAYAPPFQVAEICSLGLICMLTSNSPRIIKLVTYPLFITGIWLSDCRVALATTILVTILMLINQLKISRAQLLTIFAICLSVAIAAITICLSKTTLDSDAERDIYSLDGRTEMWSGVILLIEQHWHTGVGFYGSRYLLVKDWPWAGQAHNSILEVALATGIIGMLFYILFISHVVRMIWRTRSTLLLGMFVYCILAGITGLSILHPCIPMFVLMVALIDSEHAPQPRLTQH